MDDSADELDKSLLARLVGESDTLDGSCHVAFRFWRMYHLDVCESTSFISLVGEGVLIIDAILDVFTPW